MRLKGNVGVVLLLACGAQLSGFSQAAPARPSDDQTRIAVIQFQPAVTATNEFRRDLAALEKKFEPKKNELKSLSDEIDGLKKQLETQGPELNDDARASLGRQIDSKQKSFSRAQEDTQSDYTEQQNEIVQKLLQKLFPVVDRYAKDNGFTLVIDGSKPWPEWPVPFR